MSDLIDLIPDHGYMNSAKGIPLELRSVKEILPSSYHDQHDWVKRTQPTVVCHDQEPLNFDFYIDGSVLLEEFIDYSQENMQIELSPTNKNLNLRYVDTWAWQTQWILLHSELNSVEIKKYESTGLFRCAYWWSHALLARDWYRYAQYDQSLVTTKFAEKLFLIYCRDITGSREYRQTFLKKLPDSTKDHCQIGSFNNKKAESHFSAEYDSHDLASTGISVVLETIFENSRIHLTEKTLRPLACRHPFLLAAGPGSLTLLKKYGFKTFSPWINESYDEISDPDLRLDAIIEEMNRLSDMPSSDMETLLAACRDIADYNQQHFFSDNFYNILVNELKENISRANNSISKKLDPRIYLENYSWNYRNQSDFSFTPAVQQTIDFLLEQDQSHQPGLDDKSSTNGDDV